MDKPKYKVTGHPKPVEREETMSKKVTKAQFEEILKESGIMYEIDYGALLNTLSILYDKSSQVYAIESTFAGVADCTKRMVEIEKSKSRKIFEGLDKLGYYDDIR